MEPEQIIVILIFLNMVLRKKERKGAGDCVHPIFTFRITNGAFFTLFDEPGKDERIRDTTAS
jgi:hypothetical protein